MSHGNKGCNMNLKSVKLRDRVMIYIEANGRIKSNGTSLIGLSYIPTTIIGAYGTSIGGMKMVLLGWSDRDTLRPTDSVAFNGNSLTYAAGGNSYSYVSNIKDYTYSSGWIPVERDIVKEFIGAAASVSTNVEWQCILPGCKKLNDQIANVCYMCGHDRTGKEPLRKNKW
jgi:hypothetical protein